MKTLKLKKDVVPVLTESRVQWLKVVQILQLSSKQKFVP